MPRGPARSMERQRFEADLPTIEARLTKEDLTYSDLAREYGLSLAAIKKAVADSGLATRLAAARRARPRGNSAREIARAKRAVARIELRKNRVAHLKMVVARGGTLVEAARELGMNKGNLSRLARQEGFIFTKPPKREFPKENTTRRR